MKRLEVIAACQYMSANGEICIAKVGDVISVTAEIAAELFAAGKVKVHNEPEQDSEQE